MKLNTIRKIVTPLLVIPLGMIGAVITFPSGQWESSGLESVFLLICVPIVLLNFFAWFHPEFFQPFLHPDDQVEQVNQENLSAWLNVTGAFLAFILLGVGTVSVISRVRARPILEQTTPPLGEVAVIPTFTKSPSKTPDVQEATIASTLTQSPEVAQIPVSGEGSSVSATPTEQIPISTNDFFTPTITLTSTITPTSTNTPDPIFSDATPMTAGTYDASNTTNMLKIGNWINQENVNAYQGNLLISNAVGNYVAFSFIGNNLVLRYQADANSGNMKVKIDESEATINQLVGNAWLSPKYEPGTHFVILTHENGSTVNLDYIVVSP